VEKLDLLRIHDISQDILINMGCGWLALALFPTQLPLIATERFATILLNLAMAFSCFVLTYFLKENSYES